MFYSINNSVKKYYFWQGEGGVSQFLIFSDTVGGGIDQFLILADKVGEGIGQFLILADKVGERIGQFLILADKGGGESEPPIVGWHHMGQPILTVKSHKIGIFF